MRKDNGIKLYKSKKKKLIGKKSKLKTILSIILTLIILCGVIFLGYSIAPPILKYLKSDKSSNAEPYVPDSQDIQNSSDVSNVSSSDDDSSSQNQASDVTMKAYYLSEESMTSISAIESELNQVDSSYTDVIVPLKGVGGYIYYATTLEDAIAASAVQSDVPLADIYNMVASKGFTPIAGIDLLYDNIYPKMYGDTAYKFEDGSTMWLDNSPSAGGKPWISPFSAGTKTYLSKITTEATTAGFKKIVCTDIIFPSFRSSDLGYIGSTVQSDTRYLALVETVNQIISTATASNASVILEADAAQIANGESEIYKPDEIENETFMVSINLEKDGDTVGETSLTGMSAADKVKTILTMVNSKTANAKVTPCIIRGSLSDAEINEIISAITSMGFESYVIK